MILTCRGEDTPTYGINNIQMVNKSTPQFKIGVFEKNLPKFLIPHS